MKDRRQLLNIVKNNELRYFNIKLGKHFYSVKLRSLFGKKRISVIIFLIFRIID